MSEKRLRILQVTPYFYPAWAYGGIPRVAYELSRSLAEAGHEVTVFTTDVLDAASRYEETSTELNGMRVRYFKNLSNSLAYNHQIYLPLGFASAVKESISGFDVVHLHGHRHLLNNVVRRHALKCGVPYVLSGHGTVVRIERRVLMKMFFDKIFGDKILRDAERFVAVSESEVEQYAELGVSSERVEVIYNGIDVGAFEELPGKGEFKERFGIKDKRIVLFLGKFTPRKGMDFLARAFAKMARSDTVLVFAGNDMGFKSRVEEIIEEEAIGDRVIFTGLLTGREKLSAYRDADCVAYPAIHEIFGLVPFEALMCGAPVVVTDDCGCGKIIGSEGIGVTVRYGEVEALAKALERLIDGGEEARAMVEKGMRFIEQRLAWPIIASKYEALYRDVSGER